MDTACNVLDEEDARETAPMLQALSVMLCSRAVYAAKNQADPADIDKLVATIGKVENLRTRPKPLASMPGQRAAAPFTTRHQVELTVVTAPHPAQPVHKNVRSTDLSAPQIAGGKNETTQ